MTPPSSHRGAFTLIEMVMSLGVLSILMGAIMSMMVLTANDIGGQRTRAERALQLETALAELRQDMQVALALQFDGSTTITLDVPNRGLSGGGAPEEIVYTVVGSNPSALARSINGGTPEIIAEGVMDFGMAAVVTTMPGADTFSDPPEPVTSPETLLVVNDSGSESASRAITDKWWIAQSFEPSLPGNTLHWNITRVQFRMKKGSGRPELYSAEMRYGVPGGDPTETVIASGAFHSSDFSGSWQWEEIAFAGMPDFAPGDTLALVLGTKEKGQAEMKWAVVEGADPVTPGSFQVSSNAGKKDTWSGATGTDDAMIRVYGTYTTLGPPE